MIAAWKTFKFLILAILMACVLAALLGIDYSRQIKFAQNAQKTLAELMFREVDFGPSQGQQKDFLQLLEGTSEYATAPDCHAVCDIDPNHFPIVEAIREHRIPLDYKQQPFIQKPFDCIEILTRMSIKSGLGPNEKPPKNPPKHMLANFAMGGRMPIKEHRYFDRNKYDPALVRVVLTLEKIQKLEDQIEKGTLKGTYGTKVVYKLHEKLTKYLRKLYRLHEMRGFVIGSQSFWIEALLLHIGIGRTTTFEWANIQSFHPKMDSAFPYKFASDLLKATLLSAQPREQLRKHQLEQGGDDDGFYIEQTLNISQVRKYGWPIFDVGVSYSSLEHSGLGRYGDALNPFGDLEAMAQAWCLTKPGGLFFLNVPYTPKLEGHIVWNAHRVYSVERLLHMAANWIIVEYVDEPEKFGVTDKILVLQKPTN